MADLDTIRNALGKTIQANVQSTLFVYADVADVVELPAILIEPATADYEMTNSRGTDCWWFNIYVVCSRNDPTIGQSQLDGFISGSGPDSIRAAVWTNCDLGLDDTQALIMNMMGYGGTFSDAQIPLVGAILKARVYTNGRA